MRRHSTVLAAVLLFLGAVSIVAQDIPKEVRYKKAPAELNAKWKAALARALANSDHVEDGFFAYVVICGPTLWKEFSPVASQQLRDAKPITIDLVSPRPIKTEGRGFRDRSEMESFWSLLIARYPGLKTARIRPARSDELLYYWATIPFLRSDPGTLERTFLST